MSPGITMGEHAVMAVQGLRVVLHAAGRTREVLRGIDLEIPEGGTLGIVGESGCGKTVLCLTLLGALRALPGAVAGRILLRAEGKVTNLTEGIERCFPDGAKQDAATIDHRAALRFKKRHTKNVAPFRGGVLAYLHQNSPQALDPLMTVERIVGEGLRRSHPDLSRKDRRKRSMDLLEALMIREPGSVLRLYPHELSVGMCKRVALAAILALEPDLMVVDEPTTGLDISVQASVLELVREVRKRHRMTMVFVSHEIDLLANVADSLVVLRDGLVADHGPADRFFGADPEVSDYTRTLLASRRYAEDGAAGGAGP